jgi:hypothetical protein
MLARTIYRGISCRRYTSVRKTLTDPAYSVWFLKFAPNKTYHVPTCDRRAFICWPRDVGLGNRLQSTRICIHVRDCILQQLLAAPVQRLLPRPGTGSVGAQVPQQHALRNKFLGACRRRPNTRRGMATARHRRAMWAASLLANTSGVGRLLSGVDDTRADTVSFRSTRCEYLCEGHDVSRVVCTSLVTVTCA